MKRIFAKVCDADYFRVRHRARVVDKIDMGAALALLARLYGRNKIDVPEALLAQARLAVANKAQDMERRDLDEANQAMIEDREVRT